MVPQYGWGSVTHSSIGRVREVEAHAAASGEDKLTVDFLGRSGWKADRSEMEVVGTSGEGSFKGSRCSRGSSVELRGGSGAHEGNIWVDGKPVCDDTFGKSTHGDVNAQVICRWAEILSGILVPCQDLELLLSILD